MAQTAATRQSASAHFVCRRKTQTANAAKRSAGSSAAVKYKHCIHAMLERNIATSRVIVGRAINIAVTPKARTRRTEPSP